MSGGPEREKLAGLKGIVTRQFRGLQIILTDRSEVSSKNAIIFLFGCVIYVLSNNIS